MHFHKLFFGTAILAALSSSVLSVPTSEIGLAISPIKERNIVLDRGLTLDSAQDALTIAAPISGIGCLVDFEPVTKTAICVIACVETLGAALIGAWKRISPSVRDIAEPSDPRLAVNIIHNWPSTAQHSTLQQLSNSFAGERLLVAYHNCTGIGCSNVYYSHHTTTSGLPVHHLSVSPRSPTNSSTSKRQSDDNTSTSEGSGEPQVYVDYIFYSGDQSDEATVAANTPDFTTQLGHMVDNPTFASEGATCFDIFDASDGQDEDSYGYLAVSQDTENTYSDQLSQFMGICGGLSE